MGRKGFWQWWCNITFCHQQRTSIKLSIFVNIEDDNSDSEARRLKIDALYGLKNSPFLVTGEKVVLEINISPGIACYNGYTGVAKKIVYEEGAPPPPKLPTFWWVEIDNCTGNSFFPPPPKKNAKIGFQFVLYKENASMQEGLESQWQWFMSSWHERGTSERHKSKPSGPKLFCTLEKKKLPMAFPVLYFPEPPKYPILVSLVTWLENVSQTNGTMKKLFNPLEDDQHVDTLSEETTSMMTT